jgi:hypothetical protein
MLRQLDLTSTEWINLDWQIDRVGKTGRPLPQAVSLRLTLILGVNPLTTRCKYHSLTHFRHKSEGTGISTVKFLRPSCTDNPSEISNNKTSDYLKERGTTT